MIMHGVAGNLGMWVGPHVGPWCGALTPRRLGVTAPGLLQIVPRRFSNKSAESPVFFLTYLAVKDTFNQLQ